MLRILSAPALALMLALAPDPAAATSQPVVTLVRGGPVQGKLVKLNGKPQPVRFRIGDGKPLTDVQITIFARGGKEVHSAVLPKIEARTQYIWRADPALRAGRYTLTWSGGRH